MYQLDAPEALIALDETASSVGSGLKTIRISPDGMVKSRNGSFVLDAEDAGRIIAEFAGHKTDLVIDFEHQTLGGAYAAPDGRAPAAGWVTKLFHEPGRGLFGMVKWNAEAVDLIRRDSYRYLSPVFSVSRETKHAVALHSAGLTNKPAIPGMDRLAASDRVLAAHMADAAMNLVDRLADLLRAKGADLADGANVEDIFRALVELLDGRSAEAAPAQPNTDSVELVALQTELAVLKEAARAREVQDVIDFAINSRRVAKEDKSKLDVIRAEAERDPANARKLVNLLPAVTPPQGRLITPSPLDTNRGRLMVNAAHEYRESPTLRGTTTLRAYVDMKLGDENQPRMSESELQTLTAR